jgi:ferrous iron transport protein B
MSTSVAERPITTRSSDATAGAPKLLLVGNPNVGKSVIFGYLTGKYVTVSNYPGTTVEVSRGRMRYGGRDWEVIDTPGINSLVPQSEDERVTRDLLLAAKPDVIVQVADAKNLRRTLLLTSQLAELGAPMLLVLNLMDEARSRGVEIDVEGIGKLFGIPVVPAVAIDGEGLYTLFKTICRARTPHDPLAAPRERVLDHEALTRLLAADETRRLPWQLTIEWLQTTDANLRREVEAWLNAEGAILNETGTRLRLRTLGARLDEMRNAFLDQAVAQYRKVQTDFIAMDGSGGALKVAFAFLAVGIAVFLFTEIGRLFGWRTPYGLANAWIEGRVIPPAQAWLNSWHLDACGKVLFGTPAADGGTYENGLLYPAITQLGLLIAPVIAPLAVVLHRSRRFAEQLGHWSRDWKTGGALLLVVLLLMYEFVGVIGAGTLVDALENNIFNTLVTPWLQGVIPPGFIYDFLVGPYGLVSVGLTYALAIVLPIVATFFIAFGLLEDSGYLPRLAILADRVFRVMGLNGKAVLPMVLGLGCDTMATMTTRILATRKERLIATLLLALGVPCSAQLGVILAISSALSPGAALTVFGVVGSQMLLVGYLSSKIIKGQRSDFIFEIPPIRTPIFKNVWTKTRYRMKWYLREALPLFLLGTLILFVLNLLRLPAQWGGMNGLELIESALAPLVTGLLHLPPQTARVLLLGFLRRDYGAAGLFEMVRDGVMTPAQIVVALIVLTLFIPCVANFFMIIREHGARKALYILAFITPFAIAVGAITGWVLKTFRIIF